MNRSLDKCGNLLMDRGPKKFIGKRFILGGCGAKEKRWECSQDILNSIKSKSNFNSLKLDVFRANVVKTVYDLRQLTKFPRKFVLSFVVRSFLKAQVITVAKIREYHIVKSKYREFLDIVRKREVKVQNVRSRSDFLYGVPDIPDKLRLVAKHDPVLRLLFSQPMRIDQGILDMGICKSVPPSRRNITVEKKERSARSATDSSDSRLLEYKKILEDYDKLILLRSGDIEEHPGPRVNNSFHGPGIVHIRNDNPPFPDGRFPGYTEDHVRSFSTANVDGARISLTTNFSVNSIKERCVMYSEFSSMPLIGSTLDVRTYRIRNAHLWLDISPEMNFYTSGDWYELAISVVYFEDAIEKNCCEYLQLTRFPLIGKDCGSHHTRITEFFGFDMKYDIDDLVGCCPQREFLIKIVVRGNVNVNVVATLNRNYSATYE